MSSFTIHCLRHWFLGPKRWPKRTSSGTMSWLQAFEPFWACQTSCSPFSQATAGAEAAPKPLPFTAIRSRDPEIDPRYPTILGSQLPSSHGPHGQDLCHTHLALVDPTGCPHNPQASHPSHCKSFATNQSKKQLRIVNPAVDCSNLM
jgi:hypothetical protein